MHFLSFGISKKSIRLFLSVQRSDKLIGIQRVGRREKIKI